MSKPFSVSDILPLLSFSTWRNYFLRLATEHEQQIEINWTQIGTSSDLLDQAIHELPPSRLDVIEHDLHDVHTLACHHGIETILKMADELRFDIGIEDLPEDTELVRVMYVRLRWPHLFHESVKIMSYEEIDWWRKRNDLRRIDPDISKANLTLLEMALTDLFKRHQGKGRRCTVTSTRCGDRYYIVAHPDDQVQSFRVHDDNGRLQIRTQRPTFLVVFAFNRRLGELEIRARGRAKLKNDLERTFARILLNQELGTWQPAAIYSLFPLTNPMFQPLTDPIDDLDILIRKLRLEIPSTKRQVWLHADETRGATDVYDMIFEYLNQQAISLESVKLTLATLTFIVRSRPGHRACKFSFDISPPSQCGLRNQPTWRVELATKYLQRWKIDVSEPLGTAVAASRA
jgi:hypothetical protein